MRLLLDTVAFIWAVTSADRISNKAMAALRSEATIREISVVSLSEVAIKQSIGKLRIGKDEVIAGIADLRLRVLPYTANHALHLRSEEHTSELQSQSNLVCRLLLEKKKKR